jgi:hypothetical protein
MPRVLHSIRLWGLAGIAAAQMALADPAPQTQLTCPVAGSQEAEVLADKLFERREYQQAGACYQAAGDMVHANLAFLKAAAPRGEDTARALRAQGDAAKSLFARVGSAFRASH